MEVNTSKKILTLKKTILIPCLMLLCIFSANLAYQTHSLFFDKYIKFSTFDVIENYLYWISSGLIIYWLFLRLISYSTVLLLRSPSLSSHKITTILLPFFSTILKVFLFLLLCNFVVLQLGFSKDISFFINKMSNILIIISIAWIIFKLITIAEQLILHFYTVNIENDNSVRKIYTQTLLLKRISLTLLTVITAGAILLLFDSVRVLGTSVLTTAGLLGLVLTFTAKRSLENIFSGLELALSHPIKIGDSIVIENEYGTVEEINFRNVVIKLCDWRRLIVPTAFFLEKSFQNWSRQATNNLVGTVYIYLDFSTSLPLLREELKNILSESSFWDGKVSGIQVSDLQERVMQLKIIASSYNPDDSWNLQCEIREKLMNFIVKKHPNYLPITRSQSFSAFKENNVTSHAQHETIENQ